MATVSHSITVTLGPELTLGELVDTFTALREFCGADTHVSAGRTTGDRPGELDSYWLRLTFMQPTGN